jgi:hypothetical protein
VGEDLALTVGADFLGDASVISASAFFNADAADGAADDPIRGFGAMNEPEGHGMTSYRR